jgi:DNA repair photolyase
VKIIYEPKGAALEYARLALNPYRGCQHRCIYCYNNGRFGKKGDFFKSAKPRMGIIGDIVKDLVEIKNKYREHECPEIQLTFLGDAYQPAESALGLTRSIIRQIIGFRIPFTILTKSPTVGHDFDLLLPYKKFRLGMSFTSIDQRLVGLWEPGTGYVEDRIQSFKIFKREGGKTWISLEPVMSVAATIAAINELHSWTDMFWIGALNHIDPPEPIDLVEAHREIMAALEFHHCKYRFKRSFTQV